MKNISTKTADQPVTIMGKIIGEDYMEKLFKVTGGRVIYDYEEFNKRK
jgi:hypothetical protein